jgi:hypothetical protein
MYFWLAILAWPYCMSNKVLNQKSNELLQMIFSKFGVSTKAKNTYFIKYKLL